jgi:hypothetical protein
MLGLHTVKLSMIETAWPLHLTKEIMRKFCVVIDFYRVDGFGFFIEPFGQTVYCPRPYLRDVSAKRRGNVRQVYFDIYKPNEKIIRVQMTVKKKAVVICKSFPWPVRDDGHVRYLANYSRAQKFSLVVFSLLPGPEAYMMARRTWKARFRKLLSCALGILEVLSK